MIIIRKSTIRDLAKIANLRNEFDLFHKRFDNLLSTESKRRQYNRRFIERKMKSKNTIIFVALCDNKIVGYTLGWIEKRAAYSFKLGYICDLFIKRECREMGIGKRLMKKMIDWFKSKKIKYVTLEVYSGNKNALKTFYYAGFKDLSRYMVKKV